MQERNTHLKDLLEAFVPADAREETFRQRMFSLLQSEAPFARNHFVPGHFTASAFVLAPTRDALLLIFHGKLRRWLQPGGHVDPADDDILSAARRELREEVGISHAPLALQGIFDVDIHVIPARKQEPQHEHFDVRFLFVAETLDVRAGSDAKDARWVPFDQITLASSDQSVMRALQKCRQRYAPKP